MERKIILAIGRQFGSGGREIGQKLAKSLGISYYDKELLAEAAKQSGLCEDVFARADERTSHGLSYAFQMGFTYMGMFNPYNDVLSNDALFRFQSEAIRGIAAKGSCVLVGRCADYVLRDEPSLISFFIHNKKEIRIHRITGYLGISVEEAKERMAKIDKSRAAYYNYYTNKTWGAASSYHFSIDASVLGIDQTVELMKAFVEKSLM